MIGVIALVVAAIALTKLRELRAELAHTRAELAALRDLVRGAPPPVAPAREPPEAPAPLRATEDPAAAAPPPPGAAPFRVPDRPATPPAAEPSPVEQRGPRFEERIAARLPVWIGSVALFLAGAFLVKYSFDKGLLGPAARVTHGVLFGVVLVVAGEFARRRFERIAQGLSASGIAVLYAALLAGTSLYHLISRPVGFGLLALTTAAAVLLSLRHGPLIAILGLVGGFVTPALIGSDEPNPATLFTYLLLLEIGLLGAARPRRWCPLAALTIAGGGAWPALVIAFEDLGTLEK